MRTNGTGGQTTVTAAGNTVTVSTTNLLDYRRLLRRLGAGAIGVSDSTHATFVINKTVAATSLKLMKALERPERTAYKMFLATKRRVSDSISVSESVTVTRV